MRVALALCVIACAGGAACGGDLDPPWQLDHDRIIAIRATPPAILPGETSVIDGFIAVKGGPTEERPPDIITVISPESLMGTLAMDNGQWVVTAPTADQLDETRTELGLMPDDVVPLQLGVAYGQSLFGLKVVGLGMTAPNPTLDLDVMTIDGAAAPAQDVEIVIGKLVDVPLFVEIGETEEINWLTSCGSMHDEDLPSAYIRVEVEDKTEGELAVVVRNESGGVTWQKWPMRAE
jgi:hypothetical protein